MPYIVYYLAMGIYMDCKYFKENEYRCKGSNCCDGTPIVDREHARKMDLLRENFGKAIFVSSGFRCSKHNSEVSGSVGNSNHTKGRAWDLYPQNPNELELLAEKAKIYFNEVILYLERGFVHVGDD